MGIKSLGMLDAWGCEKKEEGEKLFEILEFYFFTKGQNRIFIFIMECHKNMWRCRKKQP